MPVIAPPDTSTAFSIDFGEQLRIARMSDGTGLLVKAIGLDGEQIRIGVINGDATSVSTQGNPVRIEGSNGGIFRIFQDGAVDFRFTAMDVEVGETTSFRYTITDETGGTVMASVDVTWDEVAPNYDLFAAGMMGNLDRIRLTSLDDGTALLVGETAPDGTPITITAINGDPDLVTPSQDDSGGMFPGTNGGAFAVSPDAVINFAFHKSKSKPGEVSRFEYTLSAPIDGSTTGVVRLC